MIPRLIPVLVRLPVRWNMRCRNSRNVEQTEAQTASRQQLRIYLRVVTTEGYRFETDLLREDLVTEENKKSLDKESVDTKMYRSVYDRKDQELTID